MGWPTRALVSLLAACLAAGLIASALIPAVASADAGSWTQAAPMLTARTGGVAAELTGGRVLVAGGRDASGQLLTNAEVYDPSRNQWTRVAPLPAPAAGGGAAPLPGDRILVVGAFGTHFASIPPEIFDARSDTWTPTSAPPIDLYGGVAASLPGGRVLVYAGQNAVIYDPATNAWSWTAAPGGGTDGNMAAGAAPLPGGGVIVTQGNQYAQPELYDPSTNTWSYALNAEVWAPSIDDPAAPPVALEDGHVMMAGGGADPRSAIVYDASEHGWSALAPMPVARTGGVVAAPLPGDRALVAGGTAPGGGALASASIFSAPATYPTDAAHITEDSIDGQAVVGNTLAASAGYGQTFKYQWERCGAAGSCTPITPLSAPTAQPGLYTVTSADVGSRLEALIEPNGQPANATNLTAPVVWPTTTLGSPWQFLEPNPQPSLTINRTGTGGAASVTYRIAAAPGAIATFAPFSGLVHFAPGQAAAELPLPPTSDHGAPILTRGITVQLSGAQGTALVSPTETTIGVCSRLYGGCGNGAPRDPANPLMLATPPPAADLLGGARFVADYRGSAASRAAAALASSDPAGAKLIAEIAAQPNVQRFGAWNGSYPAAAVAAYLDRVTQQEPGRIPMLSTYRVVNGHCGSWSDPPAMQSAYHAWITSFAEGINIRPAVVFLEMDSLITVGCLTHHGLDVRLAELRDAVDTLAKLPHVVVYLDAGAADALPARETASLLRRAGIASIQGFFLNSTHFDWTRKEIAYGGRISRMLGGKHFVVNTAENGQGPLIPRDRAHRGNEVLCNPPNRGLGPLPTADTGFPNVDAFAWIANPGVSGGECRPGAPRTGRFWPALAIELARHANFRVR